MKSKVISLCMGVFLCGCCSSEPEAPQVIAEIEGCKVYKIWDSYRYVYTTLCQGSVDWDSRSGKVVEHNHVDTRIKPTPAPK